ncbi:uncharacterized protein F5147DRAFT_692050 [Suillus discolor]|uniref:ATPase AAA-type core domain-containing protein n=1 Tax=Suillus discolor TaxID=1912936 RepID=A0A9P7JV75_9AGAM|nr:uncharacterized protein F5147DRAFT_692050 [Suillus discolor]KAG2109708.1 hypothetical protein F5147DRAFT_692050 [Suillus discolor]
MLSAVCPLAHTRATFALLIIARTLFHSSTFHISTPPHFRFSYITPMDSLIPTSDLFHLPNSYPPHLLQSKMFFLPPFAADLPKLPLENMEAHAVNRLTWIAGYDIETHEWVTFQGLDCDESYDKRAWRKLVKDQQTMERMQSLLDTIGCSPDIPQSETVLEGMNVVLRGALGTGKKTVAYAVCNMLKRPILDIRVNDIPYLADVKPWAAKLASLAIKWNALIVIDRGDNIMRSECANNRERINLMIRAFESPGCICLWPSVLTDEQQALLRPFSAAIEFPDLDLAARRKRWLQLFGRDDLVATIFSSKHASVPTVRDTEVCAFLREIEKISWYELDASDIQDFMNMARRLAGEQDPTPQHVRECLRLWDVPLSVRSKVVRFLALHEMHPRKEPSLFRTR